MKKTKSKKQKLEDEKKQQLRQRLIDMASGAGIDDVECGDYWCYDVHALQRLIIAVSDAFSCQLEDSMQIWLKDAVSLWAYESLNDLQSWLWGMGVRA